ncbi:hypothetical protein DL771_002042 [Monosporascus sp. 5C6A]|nr:hypothetical protein DL771_002042 [Monosporascus sp. 5C6A]
MFRGHYLHGCGQSDRSPEQVDQVLSRSAWERTQFVWKTPSLEKPNGEKQQKDKTKEEGGILPPEGSIATLTTALQHEMIESSIPYMHMHLTCWELLESIKESPRPMLSGTLKRKTWSARRHGLPLSYPSNWLRRRRGDERPLQQSADVLNKFVHRNERNIWHALHDLSFQLDIKEDGFLVGQMAR